MGSLHLSRKHKELKKTTTNPLIIVDTTIDLFFSIPLNLNPRAHANFSVSRGGRTENKAEKSERGCVRSFGQKGTDQLRAQEWGR